MEKATVRDVFSNESIVKSILTMAVPTVISQMISIVYNYADTIYIGLLNEPEQVAAIALAHPIALMITAMGNFWGIGGGSMISRCLGADEKEKARRVSAFSLYGAVVLIVSVILLCSIFGDGFIRLLGASDTVLPYARKYFFWYFSLGSIPAVLSQVLAHIARNEGHSKEAALGLTIGGLLNIILDPFFIFSFGLDMGVSGAAVATFISNMISLIYFSYLFIHHKKDWLVSVSIKDSIPQKGVVKEVFTIGLPSALVQLLSGISNGVLNNLASRHGDVVVAAVGIAKKIDQLPFNISNGITQGALPLMAYSYSSGESKKCKKILKTTLCMSVLCTVIISTLIVIFARPMSYIFIRDEETISYAIKFTKCLSISIPFFSALNTVNVFFQAINKPINATVISSMRKGILDIPLMFLFERCFSILNILFTQTLMDCFTMLVSFIFLFFFIRKWNKKTNNV